MTPNCRIGSVVFCLMLFLMMSDAVAQYPCVMARPWTCFGSIELTFAANSETGTIGMQVFGNGDILLEARNKSGCQKALSLGPPPNRMLYKGVPDKEIQEGYPFIFFDYGFAAPVQALEKAYVDGPLSVPEKEAKTRVTLEDKVEATLTARRISKDKIHFKIAMLGSDLEGFVDFERKARLPDSFELSEWKDRGLKTYATVGDARAAQEGTPNPKKVR